MTPTRHWPLFARVFALYAAWSARRHFAALRVRGTLASGSAPLVVAVQHVGWWDPMVLFLLSRSRFDGGHYAMMDEQNLSRYPFFRWLGAFGVERRTRAGVLAATRYALARLDEPGARVWLFPQGELRPADARPIRCEPGAAWLAARSGARLVPVAIRYEFLDEQRPEAFVSIGAPVAVAPGTDPTEALLTAEADRLREALFAGRLDGFDRVLVGRRSISDRWSVRGPGPDA
jgi:1-acyl-sn-glycerol-3-phosphate acyltransferase